MRTLHGRQWFCGENIPSNKSKFLFKFYFCNTDDYMHLENDLKISDTPERQAIRFNFYPSFGTETCSKHEMAKWRNSELTKWRNGEMAKWQNGTKNKSQSYKIFPFHWNLHLLPNLISRLILIIIWLAPRAGKMNQILRCDWLPERARWCYLARSGLPAVSRKKNFLESHIINPGGAGSYLWSCRFSCFYDRPSKEICQSFEN